MWPPRPPHRVRTQRRVATEMPVDPTAAVVTVGTELTEGLRADSNRVEVAAALSGSGFEVRESLSVGDDELVLAAALARLSAAYALVVVTGGLGPTHDDVTREAASRALGLALRADPELEAFLEGVVARHSHAHAGDHVRSQALVLDGAEVIPPVTGTAPGQIVPTRAGLLALLPGPPREMRGMLPRVLERASGGGRAVERELGVAGMPESDVQLSAQEVLADYGDRIRLTVLAKPGDVRVILLDRGAGESALDEARDRIAERLGENCYSTRGESLPAALVRLARERGITISTAESCTGGLVAGAITEVAGASDVFVGGIVAYANSAKTNLLGVGEATLAQHGAVSAESAEEMARGAREALGSDIAVSVTGIAGPSGGTPDKPVGLVWFGIASAARVEAVSSIFPGDREGVRQRSQARALTLLIAAARES